jgi:hypothetical protein
MPTYATRTIGGLIAETREIINDTIPISGAPRFTDNELVMIANEGLSQIRAKRPDAWLTFGLRNPVPRYTLPTDANTVFPIEDQFYSPLLFYISGRAELVEDTFAEQGRAVTLMNKFVQQLLTTAS